MRDEAFWQNKLASAIAAHKALLKELDRYAQRQKRDSARCWAGGGIFICGGKFHIQDRARMIRLQRKLKQLETTKIPFYHTRLGSND